ncbi:MAG TPA: phosphatidylserine/phosphatidylglycerophosphate/cardiolipin synthase family protein [Rubrobacter sp.]|nr:phosphatidylserine/phosphatidylglycerophosphate/cardiolipin synthase family protein [Rubrobacter sp.]
MFSDPTRVLLRARGMIAGAVSDFSRLALKGFLLLAAVEALLAVTLTVAANLRRKLQDEPQEPFPREEQPEVELESSEERLMLYLDYEGLYEAMLEEIEKAERTIFIETFVWKNDEIGSRFVGALGRKAREGVEVYAIFDGVANPSASSNRFPEGVHALRYRPLSVLQPSSLLNPFNYVRSHRKILAVDGRVAFLGGFNIADAYRRRWRDTQVRVRGDLVSEIEEAFAGFWNENRTKDLPEISLTREERDWNPATVVRTNDPTRGLFPIRAMFIGPMNRAKRHIYLTSVYFVPAREIKEALIEAAGRGVDVQVLLPKQSSYALADWLARRHFGELLGAGVRIFRYDEHFVIHSKSATIDGVWSTVGSANIDSLSLFGLHEVNLEIYSERFAGRMESVFELDKTNAEELTLESWEKRPLHTKLLEKALAPIRPFA